MSALINNCNKSRLCTPQAFLMGFETANSSPTDKREVCQVGVYQTIESEYFIRSDSKVNKTISMRFFDGRVPQQRMHPEVAPTFQ